MVDLRLGGACQTVIDATDERHYDFVSIFEFNPPELFVLSLSVLRTATTCYPISSSLTVRSSRPRENGGCAVAFSKVDKCLGRTFPFRAHAQYSMHTPWAPGCGSANHRCPVFLVRLLPQSAGWGYMSSAAYYGVGRLQWNCGQMSAVFIYRYYEYLLSLANHASVWKFFGLELYEQRWTRRWVTANLTKQKLSTESSTEVCWV